MKTRTKKFIVTVFLSVSLLFSLATPAFANEISIDNKDNILSIETLIKKVYEYKDMGGNVLQKSNYIMDKSYNISDEVRYYLQDKIAIHQKVIDLYKTEKENYSISTKLLSEKKLSDTIVLYSFQVTEMYNYVGIDELTTINDVVEIKYNTEKKEVIDFYTPENYYDEAVRDDYSDKTIVGCKNQKQIYSKSIKLLNDIQNVYDEENKISVQPITTKMLLAAKSPSLNSDKIVKYARSNYNKSKPSSGNGTVPYYDFSTISGSYDCTNFVSHCQIAGGAKIYNVTGNGIKSSGWYFRSINNRSSSWSGVEQFYSYMTTNKKANTAAGDSYNYTTNGAYWGIGDVLQLKYSGASRYGHSTVITIKKKSNDNTRSYAYVTGRTSAKKNNNNAAASELAPNGSKRVINVYNK